jgi:hypothetical protein
VGVLSGLKGVAGSLRGCRWLQGNRLPLRSQGPWHATGSHGVLDFDVSCFYWYFYRPTTQIKLISSRQTLAHTSTPHYTPPDPTTLCHNDFIQMWPHLNYFFLFVFCLSWNPHWLKLKVKRYDRPDGMATYSNVKS